jgi:hypothetical protein
MSNPRTSANSWRNRRIGGSSFLVQTARSDMPDLLAFIALDRGSVAAQLPPGSRLGLLEARGNGTALFRRLLPSAPSSPLPLFSEGTSGVPHSFQCMGCLLMHLLHRGSHPLLEGCFLSAPTNPSPKKLSTTVWLFQYLIYKQGTTSLSRPRNHPGPGGCCASLKAPFPPSWQQILPHLAPAALRVASITHQICSRTTCACPKRRLSSHLWHPSNRP